MCGRFQFTFLDPEACVRCQLRQRISDKHRPARLWFAPQTGYSFERRHRKNSLSNYVTRIRSIIDADSNNFKMAVSLS